MTESHHCPACEQASLYSIEEREKIKACREKFKADNKIVLSKEETRIYYEGPPGWPTVDSQGREWNPNPNGLKYYIPSRGMTRACALDLLVGAIDLLQEDRGLMKGLEYLAARLHSRDPFIQFPVEIIIVDEVDGSESHYDVVRECIPVFTICYIESRQ